MDVDKDMNLSATAASDLEDEIKEYEHNLRRFIRTKGITMTPLGSETSDPSGSFRSIMSLIAGSTAIPQRILLGSERGQLASGQDRQSWNERVSERQTGETDPTILRPFVDRMIDRAGLPRPKNGYQTVWPVPESLNETERSHNAQRIARAVASFDSNDLPDNERVMSAGEFRTEVLGLPATREGMVLRTREPEPEMEPDEEGEEEGDEK
jgi:hypothetical protein